MSVKFTTLKFKGAKICEAFSLVSECLCKFRLGLDIDGTITQDMNEQSLVNKHQVNVAELH